MLRFSHKPNGDIVRLDFRFTAVPMSTELVVDKTRFKPSLVRNDFGQRVDGVSNSPMYHFPDGVDNGYVLGPVDTLNPDITELEMAQKQLQDKVNEQYQSVSEQLKLEVENLNNVINETQNASQTTSQNASQTN